MTPLIIFGAGMQSQMVADLVNWEFSDRYQVAGFLDDRIPAGTAGPGGAPVLGPVSAGAARLRELGADFFLALGTRCGAAKARVFREMLAAGARPASLVSPRALISPSARLGRHALVLPGVFLGAHARAGDLLVAHAGAVVEHHAVLGDHVFLGPNASVAGGAVVGSYSFVGAGASVSGGARVGEGCLVGCGAVVVRDLSPWHVAAGVPARALRLTRPGDEVPLRADLDDLSGPGEQP